MVSFLSIIPANVIFATAAVVGAVLCFLIYWLLSPLAVAYKTKKSPSYDVENYFLDSAGKKSKFPSITDAPSVYLSVVVPAYNESKRIDPMMVEMLDVLKSAQKKDNSFTWEILIVDDGSKDNTSEYVMKNYVSKESTERVRLCTLFKNNGKGGAVRKGMLRARGKYILMADADGATKASDLHELLKAIKRIERNGEGIAVGSRAHLDAQEGAKALRTPIRRLLMFGFHTLLNILVGIEGIQDTQCGFKLFTRDSVAKIFPVQHIERWAFDVELLYLAGRFGIPAVEVPVNWQEIDGSNLDPLSATLQMARDIFIIRIAYMTGIWTYNSDTVELASDMKSKGDTHAVADEPAVPTSASSVTRRRRRD